MTDWQNKDCSFDECPDRRKQLDYKKLYEDKSKDRDDLYEKLQEMRNMLTRDNKDKKDNKEDNRRSYHSPPQK